MQRTIQELFEVYSPVDDAGFPVKAEEFVVLSQEPSVTEAIAPKIARPFIEVRPTEPVPACGRVNGETPGWARGRAGRTARCFPAAWSRRVGTQGLGFFEQRPSQPSGSVDVWAEGLPASGFVARLTF